MALNVVDVVWQSGGVTGTIGYILCHDDVTDSYRCYCGVCAFNASEQKSEQSDIKRIMKWGGKVPLDVAEVIFSRELK
jgi:hypothetical protein